MKETEVQSLVVAVVRNAGGAATKLSHRFLTGVSDLLVKLPGRPAALVEVKLNDYKSKTISQRSISVIPAVTQLQFAFLKQYHTAGMPCGVLSFVEMDAKGLRGLHGAMRRLGDRETVDYMNRGESWLFWREYVALTDHTVRDRDVLMLLERLHV